MEKRGSLGFFKLRELGGGIDFSDFKFGALTFLYWSVGVGHGLFLRQVIKPVNWVDFLVNSIQSLIRRHNESEESGQQYYHSINQL